MVPDPFIDLSISPPFDLDLEDLETQTNTQVVEGLRFSTEDEDDEEFNRDCGGQQ